MTVACDHVESSARIIEFRGLDDRMGLGAERWAVGEGERLAPEAAADAAAREAVDGRLVVGEYHTAPAAWDDWGFRVERLVPVGRLPEAATRRDAVSYDDFEPTDEFVAILSNESGGRAGLGLRPQAGTDAGWECFNLLHFVGNSPVLMGVEEPTPGTELMLVPALNWGNGIVWLVQRSSDGEEWATLTWFPFTNAKPYVGKDELATDRRYPLTAMLERVRLR